MEKVKTKAFKSTKGITLIALVVTIIVLLILAGVSIAMLTGNNGILSQAGRAKKETNDAADREMLQLAVMSSFVTDGKIEINAACKMCKMCVKKGPKNDQYPRIISYLGNSLPYFTLSTH